MYKNSAKTHDISRDVSSWIFSAVAFDFLPVKCVISPIFFWKHIQSNDFKRNQVQNQMMSLLRFVKKSWLLCKKRKKKKRNPLDFLRKCKPPVINVSQLSHQSWIRMGFCWKTWKCIFFSSQINFEKMLNRDRAVQDFGYLVLVKSTTYKILFFTFSILFTIS